MDKQTLKRLSSNVNTATWTEMCAHFRDMLDKESSLLHHAEGNNIYKLQGRCAILKELMDLQTKVNAGIRDEKNGLNA